MSFKAELEQQDLEALEDLLSCFRILLHGMPEEAKNTDTFFSRTVQNAKGPISKLQQASLIDEVEGS